MRPERPMRPQRIVCLTEEPTEILYLLGAGDRIVGISAYTVRPPRAKEEKPVVSAFVDGSVEKIAALEPDLVIGFSDVQADLAAKLIRANLPVLILNQRSIDEILDVIRLIGRIVDRGEAAHAMADRLYGRVDAGRVRAARDRAEGVKRPRVYFEEWPDPMLCGSHWVSELIEIAGGDDVFADRARGKSAKERAVTAAEVLAARPDVILASWCGKPFDADALKDRAGWDALPAVANEEVHEIDASIILQPGPAALTDGLTALMEILLPHRETA